MDKKIVMLCVVFLILATASSVHSQTIPPNVWEFTDDYYDVFGEPHLTASVVGDIEYDSGTSRIFIQLMNDGLISGFETDREPSGANKANESIDAQTELNLEYDVTTAINIRGTLESENGDSIRILSGLQQAGSLRSGEVSRPMEFDIEVYKNAPSETYELTLNLTYQYQYDVKVDGYPEQEIAFWYTTRNQTFPIKIKVKPRADFEIVNVSASLVSGEQSVIYITYMNVGDEPAKDAVARISLVDPFSAIDDQAFLGSLEPGESYKAGYGITVDSDALPKTYGINTEVKYRDQHDDTRISDVMKASVVVLEPVPLSEKIGVAGFALVFAVIIGSIAIYIYRKQAKRVKKSE